MGAPAVGADNHRPGDRWKKLVAIRDSLLRSEVKSILYAIVLREDWGTGWTFAGRKKLACDGGMSLRTLEQYLPLMERAGMVETRYRFRAMALRRANAARLDTDIRELLPLRRTRSPGETVVKTATGAVLRKEQPPSTRGKTATCAASNRNPRGHKTTSETTYENISHRSPENGATHFGFAPMQKKHLEKGIYRKHLFELYDNLPPSFDHCKRVEHLLNKAARHLCMNRGRELGGVSEEQLLETAQRRISRFSSLECIWDSEERKRAVVGCVINAVAEAGCELMVGKVDSVGPAEGAIEEDSNAWRCPAGCVPLHATQAEHTAAVFKAGRRAGFWT